MTALHLQITMSIIQQYENRVLSGLMTVDEVTTIAQQAITDNEVK